MKALYALSGGWNRGEEEINEGPSEFIPKDNEGMRIKLISSRLCLEKIRERPFPTKNKIPQTINGCYKLVEKFLLKPYT